MSCRTSLLRRCCCTETHRLPGSQRRCRAGMGLAGGPTREPPFLTSSMRSTRWRTTPSWRPATMSPPAPTGSGATPAASHPCCRAVPCCLLPAWVPLLWNCTCERVPGCCSCNAICPAGCAPPLRRHRPAVALLLQTLRVPMTGAEALARSAGGTLATGIHRASTLCPVRYLSADVPVHLFTAGCVSLWRPHAHIHKAKPSG